MMLLNILRLLGDIILLKKPYFIYFHILTIIFTLLLIIFLLHKKQIKPTRWNLKITNFIITITSCLIYIGIFVILLILLRYYGFSSSFDLKIFGVMCNEILGFKLKQQILVYLSVISFILFWIIIFIYIRKILQFQMQKLFIFIYGLGLVSQKRWSYRFTDYFMYSYWSYIYFFNSISLVVHNFLRKIYIEKFISFFFASKADASQIFQRLYLSELPKKIQTLGFWGLWILVAYEIFFNNFILSLTFKYLFFYVLLRFWVDISYKFNEVDYFLVRMLWETYYTKETLYINLLSSEENCLQIAVQNDCKFIWNKKTSGFLTHPYDKRFIKMSQEEAEDNECPNGGFKSESWYNLTGNTTKCFASDELKEVNGRFFVNDLDEPEAIIYYEYLKNEYKKEAKKAGSK